MKIFLAAVALALCALAGCASSSSRAVTSPTATDYDYLYGRYAGEPQRPSLMD